ncbi:MAG: ATP-binding cassette domain-containing protein [Hyphomicrobiaceae bacterium]|nr:ATP-binding cassette domain-containing protein [Hyphomicrobiaceae bacterium]
MGGGETERASAPAIACDGVRFCWPRPSRFAIAVDRFEVARGERLLLLGPSGGGKSTLLSLVAGIVAPQQGRIAVVGEDIARLSGPARDRFRAEHIGIVFQMFNLLPYGSALDNVLLPLAFSPARRARAGTGAAARAEAVGLLARLGLDEAAIAAPRAASLSVGQQQRIAVARALVGGPDIIIADEPTSALDRAHQGRFLDLLFDTLGETKATLVMVSHDESLTARFSRVVALSDIARAENGSGRLSGAGAQA